MANSHKDTHQWQRISPIALLYFLLMFFKNIFGNIVYLMPALLLLYNKVNEQPNIWLPIIYGVGALAVLFSILSFYFFQYRLIDQQIEIKSGVFAKKHINLPFSRIQNVELTEPLYYRPFGYACLQLDTAGSVKQEAKVVAIKKTFAEQLKQEILLANKQSAEQGHTNEDSINNETEQEIEAETVIDRRNLDDLVIHGLTNNRVWIFIGGLMPFMDTIFEKLSESLMYWGINVEQYFEFDGMSGWQIATTAVTLTIMIMLPITLFSIIGSIIAFHGFTLSKSGDRYIRRSGLFTRNEVTMRLSRLQMIVRQQDWLDVLLRRTNLKFEQSNGNFQNIQPGALSNKIIVPSVTKTECQHLINDAYPNNDLFDIAFKRVSIRLFIRNIFLFLLPISAFFISLVIFSGKNDSLPIVLSVSAVIAILLFCRYLRWGYASDQDFIYVRKGCIGVDYYCFPRYKVQQSSYMQSWFLKRHNLCSIEMVLASGAIRIPFLPVEHGISLIDDSLMVVEKTKQNWM